jgi:15-cis-phytoene synthase
MLTHTCPNSTFDELLATKGKSFYWARFFLVKKYAIRATRLYAFCRVLDDIADDPPVNTDPRVLLTNISRDLRNSSSDDPRVSDALALFAECDIAAEIPLELIRGMISDLDLVQIKSHSELLQYCYRVAGTVGLMMCAIFDVRDRQARYHAIDLGVAMQLTNICRDVKEDALNNRRYLPTEWLGDIKPQLLIAPSEHIKDNARTGIKNLLDLADQYYRSGVHGLPFLPLGARIAILIAARLYRSIGVQISHNNFDVWSSRIVVSRPSKAMLTCWLLLSCPWQPKFWRVKTAHNRELHSELISLPHAHTQAENYAS